MGASEGRATFFLTVPASECLRLEVCEVEHPHDRSIAKGCVFIQRRAIYCHDGAPIRCQAGLDVVYLCPINDVTIGVQVAPRSSLVDVVDLCYVRELLRQLDSANILRVALEGATEHELLADRNRVTAHRRERAH